jgi:hypothetical protein
MTDRLVNLDDYKNLEERKPIWTTTMNDRYATAMDAFINPNNTMVQRTGGLLLATAVLPHKVVEDAVTHFPSILSTTQRMLPTTHSLPFTSPTQGTNCWNP